MAGLENHPELQIHQVATPSLGDHSYVITVGDSSVVIDPQRDIDRFVSLLGASRPLAVLETHVHNDYVSGGSILASEYGCRYVVPAESGLEIDHHPIAHGDTLDIGEGWSLRAIHTPGHTPHHTSYALAAESGEVVVFSGGSMLVGAVGRTDLVDPDLTEGLTRDQYRSVRKLAEILDDPVTVAPTHGAGSFCVSGPASRASTSTIGQERQTNPALIINTEDDFVAAQLANLGLHPAYYAHMAPINRVGGSPFPSLPPVVGAAELEAFKGWIYDLRHPVAFGEGHVAGSINIPYAPASSAYTGWVGGWNEPCMLVADSQEKAEAMATDMARIGYDNIAGLVVDGLAAWKASGRPLATSRVARFTDLVAEKPEHILDVRDPIEVRAMVPGATLTHVSAVDPAAMPGAPVWVHCASGYRAAMAASKLNAAGVPAVLVLDQFHAYAGPVQSA